MVICQIVPLPPKGIAKTITTRMATMARQEPRIIKSLVLDFGSLADLVSGVTSGLISGVAAGATDVLALISASGFGVSVVWLVSGVGCGVILLFSPCPLGAKLLLSMFILYYTFYVYLKMTLIFMWACSKLEER